MTTPGGNSPYVTPGPPSGNFSAFSDLDSELLNLSPVRVSVGVICTKNNKANSLGFYVNVLFQGGECYDPW